MAAPESLGRIVAAHPDATYTVRLTDDRYVSASLHGKLRAQAVSTRGRLHIGDEVTIALSPFDRECGVFLKRQTF